MRVALLLFLFLSVPVHAQSRQEKKEAKQQRKVESFNAMRAMIDTSLYEFIARKAQPQGGGVIDLTTHVNFLRVIKDSASANLPFFGRAYSAAYSDIDGGIKFEGTMDKYKVTENTKKLELRITFRVSVASDVFDCTLVVLSSENTSLSIVSQRRALMSYTGYISSFKP